jgi:hypothetical protein
MDYLNHLLTALCFVFAMTLAVPVRLCGALTSSGTPCRRACLRGGVKCALHGGASPDALRVATETLIGARVLAARVLLEVMDNWTADLCDTCGRPKGDPIPVIRAAQLVLDRTGLGPTSTLTVDHATGGASYARWMTQEQARTVGEIVADSKARMEAGEPPPFLRLAEVAPYEQDGPLIPDGIRDANERTDKSTCETNE